MTCVKCQREIEAESSVLPLLRCAGQADRGTPAIRAYSR